MTRTRRLTLEVLEDRTTPAVYGVPWSDPTHLTLSFAPDGTPISGQTSALFATLDAQEPTVAWQTDILRAVQTWGVNTNLNVGVVPDDGRAFGSSVSVYQSQRVGNIRIGAAPLSPDVLAFSVPHDPYLSGNWSGDILLNSTIDFTQPQTNLYGVLLHEFGHVFGLAPSPDPNSVMYENATWVTTQLAASDVTAIQALYGTPAPNRSRNHTVQTASAIRSDNDGAPFTGTTPLLASGNLTALGQHDFYAVQTLASTGPMTFRLQTAGLSLLAPELIVSDASGNVVGQAQSTSVLGDSVTVHLDSVTANTIYYIRVQATTSDLFAVGRYRIGVTFDSLLKTSPNQLAALLSSVQGGDSSDDARPGTIVALRTSSGYSANQHYETHGSLSHATTYSLQSPLSPSGTPLTLTVAVSISGETSVPPQVQVLDANQQPIAATVLVNDTSGSTIQASGLAPGQTFYLTLTPPAAGEQEDVNVSLVVDFKQTSSVLPVLAAATVTTDAPSPAYALDVAVDQVFNFTLSAASVDAPAGSAVQMTIADGNGNIVFSLSAFAGQTVTGPFALLSPGAYHVSFSVLTPDGGPGSLTFQLRGTSITDPIGPGITNPTYSPTYTNPSSPFIYYNPDGTVSLSWFLFVSLVW
jgi:hypothetical protein